MPSSSTPPEVLLRELVDEADRRRSELDPGYEDRLDRLFAALTPGSGPPGSEAQPLLEALERAAGFELDVPVASRRVGGRLVKRVTRALTAWYVRAVAEQFARFALAALQAIRTVIGELTELRQSAASPALLADALPGRRGSAWWVDPVVSALQPHGSAVLHADCGEGVLLVALAQAGMSAYGIDPSPAAVRQASAAGCEAQVSEVLDHLDWLPEQHLGGIVLGGSVQWLSPGALERVTSLAASRLVAEGTLIVVSAFPGSWDRLAGPVLADLAPGRPVRPETWGWLLARAGFSVRSVLEGPAGEDGGPDEYMVVADIDARS